MFSRQDNNTGGSVPALHVPGTLLAWLGAVLYSENYAQTVRALWPVAVRLSQKYQTCPFLPGPFGQPNIYYPLFLPGPIGQPTIYYDKRKTTNSKPTNSKYICFF
jgi:hypothetical protein